MSSQPSLPANFVDRLFARFAAIYGSQKVGTMFADMDAEAIAEAKALWGRQLGRFEAASIGGALQRLIDGGVGWPPTLPEFVELCRQSAVARRGAQDAAVLLMAPGQAFTDNETAKRKVAELLAELAGNKRMP